ncbi:MAG: ABC transporter permease [Bacillaceae bacterium]
MKPNFSSLHKQYVKRLFGESVFVAAMQIVLLVICIGMWQIASDQRWIDPLLFSSPKLIFNYLITEFKTGSINIHLLTTLIETIASFLISTIVGTMIAALLWWSSRLSRIMDPFLVVLNALPKVAIGPIIIVIFGPSIQSVIVMGVLVSIIITILVIYQSFKETEPNYIKVMQTFGASKWQIFRKCIFPSSIPTIVSTLKVNVGLAWVGVIVGEFLVSKNGLGYLIVYGFQIFNFTLVLASVVLILLLATIMYIAVERFEKMVHKNR